MCTACDWAPYFEAFGRSRTMSRRTVLRAGAAMTAATALVPGFFATDARAEEVKTGTDGAADFVFHNGRVYTVAGAAPWADAVAVRGNTIVHVGDEAGAKAMTGPKTQVIDLKGRLLMPGFVEGHTHPFLGAFMTSGLDLQLANLPEVLAAIERYAKANPTGPIRGFGWRVDMFPPEGPNRAELDAIIPDRPAFFFAIDGHSLWANSKALEMAGVSRDTPDPIPRFSYYARDQKGDPTGYVLETNAVLTLVNAVEPISAEAMGRLLESWLPKAAAAGITTVFDAGVPPVGSDQGAIIELYVDAEKRGKLPFRVSASYSVKSLPIDNVVAEVSALNKQIATDLVHVDIVKIVGDGSQGGYTAWLIEPYADMPDSTGGSPFTEEQWHQLIAAVDAAGFDVHVHACGERTARVALDSIEKAIAANPPRDRRNAIAHLVYVEDTDNPRFAKLNVTAQFSAYWSSADPDTLENMVARYGEARGNKIYRTKTILNQGGRVSFGTDWPAAGYFSTYEPLKSIQVGVTRQLIGLKDAPVLSPADERLTVEEAIHANTMGAAYQLRMDHQVGSIEVGKLADLIILDRNILEGDPHEIHKAKVEMSMMNGTIRHKA
ncbi:MAG: twin-arginine translocation pathway signal protein [Ancylobacter novellus]|uniref:Twin-arginine translocation pathway signal protein n=1 Tax=Ancylobacter novellus TaxID=921 RepID=A0A2W5SMY7_ANCNO|nr:MAG: twin-arginine translocation pathway signal protein [Ancylobacter novellus]